MNILPLPQIGSIDPNDLGNGWYNHIRHVGPDDPEFLNILGWLILKGAPKDVILIAEPVNNPSDPNRFGPASLRFSEPAAVQALKNEDSARKTYDLDASQAFNYPRTALIGLKVFFGFGNPNLLEDYPGIRQPLQYVEASPLGFPWPEQSTIYGRPAFHGSGVDNINKYPEDSVYTDSSGSYKKIQRKWAFFNAEPVWVKQ